ncbi:MAG: hypothetical protein HYZ45_00645 [Burkholderiales bacterium]|nr:hypothetical protein [Burkholderiales bacterium]
MDNNAIFDKSDKGREEIITRKYRLAPRLRSLLVLIDGKKTAGELLQQVAGLGLDKNSLDQLYEEQFIEPSSTPLPMAKPMQTQAPQTPDEAAANASSDSTSNTPPSSASASSNTANASNSGNGLIGATQILALQTFFNTTIKSTLGFRGFTLQLKAERAVTLEDFQNLRQPYFDAVVKAKGQDMALALRDRLDQLISDAAQSMR